MNEKLEQFAKAVEDSQRKALTEWAERNEKKGPEARAAFVAKLEERADLRSGAFAYTTGWDGAGIVRAEVHTEMALNILKGVGNVGQKIEGGWRDGEVYTWTAFVSDIERELMSKIERGTAASRGGNVMTNAAEIAAGDAAVRLLQELNRELQQGERDARASYCPAEREALRILRKERGEVGELFNRARSETNRAAHLKRGGELDAQIRDAEADLELALDAAGANGAEGLLRYTEAVA